MMKVKIKSYIKDNRGSAIITGLVVTAVLMIMCLSLLLVSYNLFLSISNSASDLSNRELLYSAAEALEKEFVGKETDITKINLESDDLFTYIYKNINDNSWPPYNGNNLEEASKYFELNAYGAYKIEVQLYWQSYVSENKTVRMLNAIYSLYQKDEMLVKTERKYKLDEKSEINGATPERVTCNFEYTGEWNTGYRAEVVLTNNSDKDYESWMLYLITDDVIQFNGSNYTMDGATVLKKVDNGYIIIPLAYTQDLLNDINNNSVTFHYNSASPPSVKPTMVFLQPTYSIVDKENYEYEISPTVWNNGLEGHYMINIINKSIIDAINDWRLEFSFNKTIGDINNAEILSHENNVYLVRNINGQNSVIQPNNGNQSFNFSASGGTSNDSIDIINLYQLSYVADGTGDAGLETTNTWKWKRIGMDTDQPGGDP